MLIAIIIIACARYDQEMRRDKIMENDNDETKILLLRVFNSGKMCKTIVLNFRIHVLIDLRFLILPCYDQQPQS